MNITLFVLPAKMIDGKWVSEPFIISPGDTPDVMGTLGKLLTDGTIKLKDASDAEKVLWEVTDCNKDLVQVGVGGIIQATITPGGVKITTYSSSDEMLKATSVSNSTE